MGRWSDSGGLMVPAVTLTGIVVTMMSSSVAVLCVSSYRVGVVIVVFRLFSVRNEKKR